MHHCYTSESTWKYATQTVCLSGNVPSIACVKDFQNLTKNILLTFAKILLQGRSFNLKERTKNLIFFANNDKYVLLDMSNTFDSVDRDLLRSKLYCYGIRDRELGLVPASGVALNEQS